MLPPRGGALRRTGGEEEPDDEGEGDRRPRPRRGGEGEGERPRRGMSNGADVCACGCVCGQACSNRTGRFKPAKNKIKFAMRKGTGASGQATHTTQIT